MVDQNVTVHNVIAFVVFCLVLPLIKHFSCRNWRCCVQQIFWRKQITPADVHSSLYHTLYFIGCAGLLSEYRYKSMCHFDCGSREVRSVSEFISITSNFCGYHCRWVHIKIHSCVYSLARLLFPTIGSPRHLHLDAQLIVSYTPSVYLYDRTSIKYLGKNSLHQTNIISPQTLFTCRYCACIWTMLDVILYHWIIDGM